MQPMNLNLSLSLSNKIKGEKVLQQAFVKLLSLNNGEKTQYQSTWNEIYFSDKQTPTTSDLKLNLF